MATDSISTTPQIRMGCDEDVCSIHSLVEYSNNNNSNSAEDRMDPQHLSPSLSTLMPSQSRPHSNSVSVCTSLLAPDMSKRSQMHRASDSLLISDNYRKQQERRSSQIRSSVIDQEIYWKTNEGWID